MIVVYGTVCLDRIRRVSRLPLPGGYVEIEEERLELGGEAANTVAALQAWGASASLVGNSLGDGPESEIVRRLILGLKLQSVRLPERTHLCPVCDIYVTPDGERTMFGRGFLEMEHHHGLEGLDLRSADWLALDDNHGSAAREAMVRSRGTSARVYALDFLRPNEPIQPGNFWQSSTDWTQTRTDESSRDWLQRWHQQYGATGILTSGASGFWLVQPGREAVHLPSYPCPKVVDATGAGDAFRAGMLFGLDQDWPLSKCLSWGSAAGALACTRIGGAANAPSAIDIERLIASHPDIRKQHEAAA